MTANTTRRQELLQGMRDGVPIGLGYFAVSFSLGILAKNVGLTPLQAAIMSLFNNASAGEYMGLYMYGGMIPAIPGWAIGTALGTLAGSILPLRVVSAFSVALYGMFIAIFIPPARKDKVIAVLVVLAFAASWGFASLPVVSDLSDGTRTIILTVILSAGAAALFPRKDDEGKEDGT